VEPDPDPRPRITLSHPEHAAGGLCAIAGGPRHASARSPDFKLRQTAGEIRAVPADDARPGVWLQLRLDRAVPGCARPTEAKSPQFGQNCHLVEPAVVAVFGCYEGCSNARSYAMSEREELLSKLKRYSTLRDLISDERAVAVIGELMIRIEVRLAQIENLVRDQTALRPTLGEVPK
jgi:hypothetical protein